MNDTGSLDSLCINTIRFLAVDAVQKANSGHPGMPLGASPAAYVLWTKFLRHNPTNPQWFNRDRFILSAGHASMLLYSLLHLTGYDLSLEDIKQFRQWKSKTPGHPERLHTPGVEVTTGPLGQGFANGVGMAIAEQSLAARYNRRGFNVIDHHTYVLASDGDLMEGVASEAASLAGHLKLGKLIVLYDANHISLAASTNATFTEDVGKRFRAYGWQTQTVDDGNDLEAIRSAIFSARNETERPSLIIVHSHIGYGSPHKQDSFEAHGSPLGENEVKATKKNLGWPEDKFFYIPEEALKHFRAAIASGQAAESEWKKILEQYRQTHPVPSAELQMAIEGKLPEEWTDSLPEFPSGEKIATRAASGKVMNAIAQKLPMLIGGSADLNPSTKSVLKNLGDFQNQAYGSGDTQGSSGNGWNYAGRNIHFGVREHAMGSTANGMAAHGGVIPYTATFMTFSDYMRPAFRLASLMKLHVINIFTHDSIGLGEDGPTHQPVEHLASLRAIPRVVVLRPADATETAVAWQIAVESKDRPVIMVFTRQGVPTLDRQTLAPADSVRRGAYILSAGGDGEPDLILMGSGSEVHLLLDAQKKLQSMNIATRVVSMPSWELFEEQSDEYKRSVLPVSVRARLSVEAGVTQGWKKYVGDSGDTIGVDTFGASAPGPKVMEEYGFTAENIVARAQKLVAEQAAAAT
ncbi:MAG TPA: transketolase [candidate division Zixibacteria bacterium]|nr:transketolase [candidate division Zixibacteria bacterium]